MSDSEKNQWLNLLRKGYACNEAKEWLSAQSSAERAWQECHRADWMLWLAVHVDVDRRIIVKAACEIARTVIHLIPSEDDRFIVAIETAEAWCRGKATAEEAKEAADAARCAAHCTAHAAGYAASYAVRTVNNASYAAHAAHAAHAAANPAGYAASYAAIKAHLMQGASVVRKHISYHCIAEAAGIGDGNE